MKRLMLMLCAALACALLVGACGGDDDEGGGGGGGGGAASEEKGSTEGAKVIDPALIEGAKGEVKYCQGKDTSGNATEMVKRFNEQFGPDLTAKLVEFPASADEQRNQFIQRQQAKSGDCDVFSADVIWTAEFASQKWLYDLTPYMEDKKGEFIEAPIETVTYDEKIWGSPETSDAAMLYYRSDQVDTPPTTWQEVYEQAGQAGIVYQGAPYEGLTCDFLELAFAAGGTVLSEDGLKPTINSPENIKALQFMMDGVKNGTAPKAVTTYMEPESLAAWQTGKYKFMRNWPYAYAISQSDDSPKIKGKFEVMAFPEFEGGGKAAILGGHNSVISVYSKNPGAALKIVDFIGSPEIQQMYAADFSLTPVRSEVYDDPAVKKALPFAEELRQSVTQAKSRPVSPVYPQISQAIYKNVNRAISGQTSAEEAMKQAEADIENALATF